MVGDCAGAERVARRKRRCRARKHTTRAGWLGTDQVRRGLSSMRQCGTAQMLALQAGLLLLGRVPEERLEASQSIVRSPGSALSCAPRAGCARTRRTNCLCTAVN
eukprot:Amastigsp_a3934_48.p3 type:complete len:105 gc:universal Amastigsp_a3934_48:542-856(+)